jgi:hypothetical protein
MRHTVFALIVLAYAAAGALPNWVAAESSLHVGQFKQEVHTAYTEADGLPSNDVRAIAVVPNRYVAAATAAATATFADGAWQKRAGEEGEPIMFLATLEKWPFCIFAKEEAVVGWSDDGKTWDIPVPARITVMRFVGERLVIGTVDGLHEFTESRVEPVAELNALLGDDKAVSDVAGLNNELAIAAHTGLFVLNGQDCRRVYPQQGGRRWAPLDVRAVVYDAQGRLWFACPQGVGCRVRKGEWKLFTGGDGLPYNDFTCMAAGPDGAVWFGTKNGAVKYEDGVWGYREGRRWIIKNEVRDIAITPEGDVWLATAGGISRIESRPMTLAEKAAFYEDEIDLHHRRTPYGYVVNAVLARPGDKSEWVTPVTDNDGQYTGLYVGAECLAYAATGDAKFKKRATDVFEALAFLSEVTQGGSHPAPSGFIARAIMPTSGPNPNEGDSPERDREKQQGDKLWKIMDPRWPISEDGKWYWKSDTSSDELDGHYFAYGLYYDHVAETDAEKARCREVVRRVTDHLIDHDFRLVDHDGKPTRWARFSPKDLNDDPDWWAERGLNSLSILTYLSIAHHVTEDPKYREVYVKLVRDHQYALNGMCMPKMQSGPGSFVQFDDKMAFINYYHLIRYETDPELLRMYYESIYHYWNIEKYELNPFFNFAYAACCLGKTRIDQWGALEISPTGPWLEQSVDTLKRYQLDLMNWRMTNTHRLDILPLPDHVREDRQHRGKGYRVNGHVLPIDERQALSWSEDAWALTTGGDGRRLRDGCPYLLAYYMGLHHRYIME